MKVPNIPQVATAGMTVGSLRTLLAGLPDLTPIEVIWEPGHMPGDSAPAVRVFGFQRDNKHDASELLVRVGLEWLNEEDE